MSNNSVTDVNDVWYEPWERSGVIVLAVAGLLSICSVLYVMRYLISTTKAFRTHLFEYLVSLLLANVIQSIGTTMNLRWVVKNGLSNGSFCTAQGAIKQAGNISTALWSFMISLHLFNILFLRTSVTRLGLWLTLAGGWFAVAFIVFIGPAAIEKPESGPYFGISGRWCWITSSYPEPQILLEYFLEFLSATLAFILNTIVLLRVRGNLVHHQGKWKLQFISSDESWRLGFARDLIDSTMLKLAQRMVWFPRRIHHHPHPYHHHSSHRIHGPNTSSFGATVFAAVIFNLTGFINVLLIIIIRHVFPDMQSLPEFNTPRRNDQDQEMAYNSKSGVTPFMLMQSEEAESYRREREVRQARARERAQQNLALGLSRQGSVGSVESQSSVKSTTGLIPK